MANIQDEPAYSSNVLEFITVAHRFTLILESPNEHDRSVFLPIVLKILPLLYVKAALLPELPEPDNEANERFVTLEQYETVFNQLRGVFGNQDVNFILDGIDNEGAVIKSSISELLTDIYQDTRDFVLLYQRQSRLAKQNAVYHAKVNFEQYWGLKAVNCMKMIHIILFGNKMREIL